MKAQLFDRLLHDFLFFGAALSLFELVEEGFHGVVIAFQHRDRVILIVRQPLKHFPSQLSDQPIRHFR
jgi:hypothetical protein